MNAPAHLDTIPLDRLATGTPAAVVTIAWATLDEEDAARLRHFGFDNGVRVQALHSGPIGGDPLAIRVGRMTVAIRRKHAAAIRVLPLDE